MITLQTLKWSNCFSYGENNELDLSSDTLTQIIGSNGVGKSSIALIIEEALFNKNSKGVKKADIPNRQSDGKYSIYLSFQKDNSLYEIDITRKSTAKVVLLKDGEDISSHTATGTFNTIKEILGMDFKFFPQLIYQNTNSSLQFLTSTDTVRKRFLIDLLHLEHYTKLYDIFKDAAKASNSNLTSVSSKIDTIEKWLSENKLEDTSPKPILKIDFETEEDEKQAGLLQNEIENISEKNKKISRNNQYKELLKKLDLEEAKKIETTELLSYDDLQKQEGSYRAEMSAAKKLLDKMQSLGDSCPTCEQDIDSSFKNSLIEEESVKIGKLKDEQERLKKRIEEIKENNRLHQKKMSIQKEWEDLYRSIDQSLPSTVLNKEELTERLETVQKRLNSKRQEIRKLQAENQKRTQYNTRLEVIQEQTDKFLSELAEYTELLTEEKKLHSNLEVLKKAFSTNGLLAYKIENLVKELEDLTNNYLGELSDGRFSLSFEVSKDKLNVVISDNGRDVDINSLSSGELSRVNTATLIAIRKLMSSISKSRINILFLDEVINTLDLQGREKLVEVLLQEKDLNTFIVSHGWSHPLLRKVEITKEKGFSRLEV